MEFSLGLVEVSSLGNAIMMLDEMTKAADVEFVACERKLGGRLVTIVVRGSVSSVTASVEAGKAAAIRMNCLKAAEVIARPHHEIFKFLHLDEQKDTEPNSESAATHTGSVPSKKIEEKAKPVSKSRTRRTVSARKSGAETAMKKAEILNEGADKKAPRGRGRKKQS